MFVQRYREGEREYDKHNGRDNSRIFMLCNSKDYMT